MTRSQKPVAGALLLVILLADAHTRYRRTSQALEPLDLGEAPEGAGVQAAFSLVGL